MAFHPEKCTSLPVTRTRKSLEHQYELCGHILETVSSAKYLGVTISRDMKWSKHINNVCTKANKTLSFLKRNLNITLSAPGRLRRWPTNHMFTQLWSMRIRCGTHTPSNISTTLRPSSVEQHVLSCDNIKERPAPPL